MEDSRFDADLETKQDRSDIRERDDRVIPFAGADHQLATAVAELTLTRCEVDDPPAVDGELLSRTSLHTPTCRQTTLRLEAGATEDISADDLGFAQAEDDID